MSNSSTSTSDTPSFRPRRCAGFAAAFVGAALTVTAIAIGFQFGGGGGLPLPGRATPSGSEWFYAFGFPGGTPEHDVLWYGIGPSIDNAREADIILVGSSLMANMGWRPMEDFRERTGIRVFNLAASWDYSVQFWEALFLRHDLRPRILVVDGHPNAFLTGQSPYADMVRKEGGWARMKGVLAKSVSLRLHAWRAWLRGEGTIRDVAYKSAVHGGRLLDLYTIAPQRKPIANPDPPGCAASIESGLPAAQAFVERMARLGTKVVFTRIPQDFMCERTAIRLAEATGSDYVPIPWDGMQTTDGTHVVPRDADRAAAALIAGIEQSSAFRALGVPQGDRPAPSPRPAEVQWQADIVKGSEPSKAEVVGFRQPEPASGDLPGAVRWANAAVSRVALSAPDRAGRLKISFNRYFQKTRAMEVVVNGRTVARFDLPDNQWQSETLPLPKPKGGKLVIELRFDGPPDADMRVLFSEFLVVTD